MLIKIHPSDCQRQNTKKPAPGKGLSLSEILTVPAHLFHALENSAAIITLAYGILGE